MKKILIIEDDQIVANVYRNKLSVEGYQAEIASDGETGLKLMRTFKPELIVLDLMPVSYTHLIMSPAVWIPCAT